MERFLIALDNTPHSLKIIHYVNRTLRGADYVHLTLFHVLPTASPNLLKQSEVQRIEQLHEEMPHLSGYFWSSEDEEKMNRAFLEARGFLNQAGFSEAQISTRFRVQSVEIAQAILDEARSLRCGTVVLGRRGLGRVKEFFLGSVSTTVTKTARELTVWVVGD